VPIVLFTLLDLWGLEAPARNADICRVIPKSEAWKLIECIEEIVSGSEENAKFKGVS
jgi:hypothetical protein